MEIARKADNAQPYNFRSAEPLTTQQSSKKKDKKTRTQEDAICRYALHHDVLIGEVWYPHILGMAGLATSSNKRSGRSCIKRKNHIKRSHEFKPNLS